MATSEQRNYAKSFLEAATAEKALRELLAAKAMSNTASRL
jgi:hypothetical protein